MLATKDNTPQHLCQGNFVLITSSSFSTQTLAAIWILRNTPEIEQPINSSQRCKTTGSTLENALKAFSNVLCGHYTERRRALCNRSSDVLTLIELVSTVKPRHEQIYAITLCSVWSVSLPEERPACCDGEGRLASGRVHRVEVSL